MFLKSDMTRLYAEHGNALGWFDEDGDGPFSANPGDYWNVAESEELPGTLAVLTPSFYSTVN